MKKTIWWILLIAAVAGGGYYGWQKYYGPEAVAKAQDNEPRAAPVACVP